MEYIRVKVYISFVRDCQLSFNRFAITVNAAAVHLSVEQFPPVSGPGIWVRLRRSLLRPTKQDVIKHKMYELKRADAAIWNEWLL